MRKQYLLECITVCVCCTGEGEEAGVDSLEAYMDNIGGYLDRGKRQEFRQQLHGLKKVGS